MASVSFDPIGHVESPFDTPSSVPRPANDMVAASGTVVIDEAYEPGLLGLDSFSHIVLVSHLHRTDDVRLRVRPKGEAEVGIFATSGTVRPNPIGLSVVALDGIEGTRLSVSHIDLVDGTPILDIKPFAPKIRDLSELEMGWMDETG